MTTFNKSSLKLLFEQGDIPTGQNYSDFIDSYVNIVETTVQSMAGPLNTTELITPRVSANTINLGQFGTIEGTPTFGNTVNFASAVNFQKSVSMSGTLIISSSANIDDDLIVGGNINAQGNLTAFGTVSFPSVTVSAAGLNLTGDVSAAGTVYASIVRSTNGVIGSVGIVSAAGTAQATAALLTNVTNRGKGVVDGTTTGFKPLANNAGLTQYLYNEGASANLWPPTGGTINGLAVNAPLPLVTSAMVTIVHLTASAYAVK